MLKIELEFMEVVMRSLKRIADNLDKKTSDESVFSEVQAKHDIDDLKRIVEEGYIDVPSAKQLTDKDFQAIQTEFRKKANWQMAEYDLMIQSIKDYLQKKDASTADNKKVVYLVTEDQDDWAISNRRNYIFESEDEAHAKANALFVAFKKAHPELDFLDDVNSLEEILMDGNESVVAEIEVDDAIWHYFVISEYTILAE